MYEPIRTKSVPTMAEPEFPHRSRGEALDIQLAGYLTALLAVTDELRALSPGLDLGPDLGPDLDQAARRISEQVARLPRGVRPQQSADTGAASDSRSAAGGEVRARAEALHRRAHALAGRALVVAACRADTAAAILAAERMDAHAAALGTGPAPSPALSAAR